MKLRSNEDSIQDVEGKIMSAWQTISDIDLVYYAMEDMTEDEKMNAMGGLKELGEARFKDLWRVFEQFSAQYYESAEEPWGEPSDDLPVKTGTINIKNKHLM